MYINDDLIGELLQEFREYILCEQCLGAGTQETDARVGVDEYVRVKTQCHRCNGSGRMIKITNIHRTEKLKWI